MTPKMQWVSFHTHTTHSHADGFESPKIHIHRVGPELGMSAWCVTEHGNPNSWPEGERECKEVGIKFIPGVEAYFAPPGQKRKFHITLIAMDEEGLRNLNAIITQSWLDFYQWPTVTWENLKKHSRGIAATSGCADSLISCSLLGGKSLGPKRETYTEQEYLKTRRKVQRFLDVFEDRFYLEVQRFSGLPRTRVLNPAFSRIGKELGVPLLATADVHYPYPHQNKMQQVLHAAKRKSTVAVAEAEWEYDILLTYPESDEEIEQDLMGTGLSVDESKQAVLETAALASRCEVELPKARPLRFAIPDAPKAIICEQKGKKASQKDLDTVASFGSVLYFKKAIKDGLAYRIQQRPEIQDRIKEYKQRINQEFKVIADKDFSDYFLVLNHLISRAKDRGTAVGWARGSAAASLIAYCLRITEIDPLHPAFDKMVFERFIDPTRSDMPDVDLDFDPAHRREIVADAISIYGQQNVANVGNHQKFRGKSALQGVARAYGLSQKTFDAIGKRCTVRTETDDRVDDSILDAIEAYSDNPEIAELLDTHLDKIKQAIDLEGQQSLLGIHAGGFVIASDPIPDVCPILTREKGSGRKKEFVQVIPYDKRDAEYLGMLKMDFLGLTTMGVFGKLIEWGVITLEEMYSLFYKQYADWQKVEERLKISKRKTFTGCEYKFILQRFCADDVVGIFQYEGGAQRQVCKKLKPETFDQLAAINALSRPGPLYGRGADGMTQTDAYIAIKNGEMDWERIHPNFDKHVEWTYGQIVYQEQIMFILRDLAGFDVSEVLRIRKIIGKKLGEHQFEAIWESFRTGCERTSGISEESAKAIFSAIRTAAGYAFNIPHAYSYTIIAWTQMWVKMRYPLEFYAATLNRNGDDKEAIKRRTALLQDALKKGIKSAKFDPSYCRENWYYSSVLDLDYRTKGKLIPGFQQMPGIAEATASDIVKWKHENYLDGPMDRITWDDLLRVKGIGKVTIEKLKSISASPDPLGITRTSDQLESFREQLVSGEFDDTPIPSAEEFVTSDSVPQEADYCAFVGFVSDFVFRDEVETIRSRTGKSIEQIRSEMDDPEKTKKSTLFAYDEFGEVALRVSRWVYPNLAARISSIKKDHHIVVAYGRTFDRGGNAIQVRQIWILDPDE